MDKIRTTVKIAGREYALTSFDTEDYVRRVADYVDHKLNEMSLATRLNPNQVAVLTTVKIADELFKAQDEITRLRRELDAIRNHKTVGG